MDARNCRTCLAGYCLLAPITDAETIMFDKRYLFPLLMVLLNLGAAIVCFTTGDWRRGIYWIAGAVCIAMVSL